MSEEFLIDECAVIKAEHYGDQGNRLWSNNKMESIKKELTNFTLEVMD